jgi:FkbM family methyltransferase
MSRSVVDAELRRHSAHDCSRLDASSVTRAFELLFHRPPESAYVVQHFLERHSDIWSLLTVLMACPEFTERNRPAAAHAAPRTTLDWQPLIERFAQPNLVARPGYITNFLGVITSVSYIARLNDAPGHVEGVPRGHNFHCHVSEWIAGLRGVELSGDDFVVVELGAGWGPWMVNLCRAAQIQGAKRVLAIGCEADETHCQYLTRHLAENGFTDHARVFQGAIGLDKGYTLFPIPDDAAGDWAMRPIFCKTQQEAQAILDDPQVHRDHRGLSFKGYRSVPCYSLTEVLEGVDVVDVLHIDVQGTELELVRHNLQLLKRRVRYLVIGTHSRRIEGGLIESLLSEGWELEVEEPCTFDIKHPWFEVQLDGTQGWRNPTL